MKEAVFNNNIMKVYLKYNITGWKYFKSTLFQNVN